MQSLDDFKTAVLTTIYIIYHLLLLYYFVYVDNLLFLYLCCTVFNSTAKRLCKYCSKRCILLRWAMPDVPSTLGTSHRPLPLASPSYSQTVSGRAVTFVTNTCKLYVLILYYFILIYCPTLLTVFIFYQLDLKLVLNPFKYHQC